MPPWARKHDIWESSKAEQRQQLHRTTTLSNVLHARKQAALRIMQTSMQVPLMPIRPHTPPVAGQPRRHAQSRVCLQSHHTCWPLHTRPDILACSKRLLWHHCKAASETVAPLYAAPRCRRHRRYLRRWQVPHFTAGACRRLLCSTQLIAASESPRPLRPAL